MEIINTNIPEVKILVPQIFGDDRGMFFEAFSESRLKAAGIEFHAVQENCAVSAKKGTVRGLHFQNNPKAQGKIVRCTKGSVMDYAVDLRKNSPTYLMHAKALLTADNKHQLYLPRGFAHGVISLEDNTVIEYIADETYSPENDRSILCTDASIGIDWDCDELILSPKDKTAPPLAMSDCNF